MGQYINGQYFSDQQLQVMGVGGQISSGIYPMQQPQQPKFSGFQNPTIMQSSPQSKNMMQSPCKIISTLDDITMADIPNDCTPAFFPVADGSAIYVKSWNNNGKVDTIKYIPEVLMQPEPQTETVSNEDVINKLNQIEKMIKGFHYGNEPKKNKGDAQ